MGEHGVKSMGGHILNSPMLLDALRKNFYGPAEPRPHHALACRGPQLIAGERRAATIRSVPQCRTHQLDLAHIAQRARGVSDAKSQSLAWVATRRQTHGVPRAPAMTTAKHGNVAPRLRWGVVRESASDLTLRVFLRAIMQCQRGSAMACAIFGSAEP